MSVLPVGQLFIVGFHGTTLGASTRALLRGAPAGAPAGAGGGLGGVGGVILFKRNIESLEQVVALNTEIHEAAPGTLVSVDQEGGRVARLRGIMTDVPSMRAVGALADAVAPDAPGAGGADLAYRVGAMMGRELVTLGFHWDFAPVVDVDTNPANPVIGERSFSRDPHAVARIGARFIAGLQGAGVAGSAKHFPGHGDTDTDSHHALPRLPHSLERLRSVELVPFVAAAEAGVASIMTAHVMFPALDAHEPATLSRAILHQLVREPPASGGLGYDGVVVSDDLEMAAVADRYDVATLVEKGLAAGCDAFLICHDEAKQHAAIEAVHKLAARDSATRERIEQALRRVAAMKAKYVGAPAAPSLDEARRVVRSAPHLELAAKLAAVQVAEGRAASPVDIG